jgi:AcrR family transcriptional regulator
MKKQTAPRRPYRSSLRAEQSGQTRERILEGVVRTMQNGIAEFSMPAVASAAGVSLPTVYRHFRTKRDLFEALEAHVVAKTGLGPHLFPQSLEDVERAARDAFVRHAELDAGWRAVFASGIGRDMRQSMLVPQRTRILERWITPLVQGLHPAERDRLIRLVTLLLTSATARAFKDYLGVGPESAAEEVGWAVRTLIRGVNAKGGRR